jgi:hypothetical protein
VNNTRTHVPNNDNSNSLAAPVEKQDLASVQAGEEFASLLYDEGMTLPAVKRLVVLVPNQDIDVATFSRKIWSLAFPDRLGILLITLPTESDYLLTAERRLTTIAAMLRDPRLHIETQVFPSRSWLKIARQVWKPGDLLVCPAEQAISTGIGKRSALALALASTFKAPVYRLKGFYQQPKAGIPNWIKTIPYWVVLLATIAGFFKFEAVVDASVKGWVGRILLLIIVAIEIGLIYLWTSLLG